MKQQNQHILISVAHKKYYNVNPEMPESAFYDLEKGYWRSGGECLVSYTSKFGTIGSKKEDLETGEDIKGQ